MLALALHCHGTHQTHHPHLITHLHLESNIYHRAAAGALLATGDNVASRSWTTSAGESYEGVLTAHAGACVWVWMYVFVDMWWQVWVHCDDMSVVGQMSRWINQTLNLTYSDTIHPTYTYTPQSRATSATGPWSPSPATTTSAGHETPPVRP